MQGVVQNIAAKDCVLFLWTTMPKLFDAQCVISDWGFTYKTAAFVWVKRNKKYNEERAKLHNGIDDFMGQGR